MKWIFLATVCAYFVFASAEDLSSEDAVVSLVLAQPSELSRQKRDQVEVVDISSRGGHRRRNKHRGGSNGAQQYPSYPTGFGGNPSGSQSGSWSSSQSSSWSNGGLTNSNSNSQSGASSLGQGGHGSGSSSSSNAGSGSWGGNGVSGSQSKSEAQSHAQGGNTGASSGAESSADAKGGFQFPGQYQ